MSHVFTEENNWRPPRGDYALHYIGRDYDSLCLRTEGSNRIETCKLVSKNNIPLVLYTPSYNSAHRWYNFLPKSSQVQLHK